MRRFLSLALIAAALVVIPAGSATAGSDKGELISAFNTEINDLRKDDLNRPDGHIGLLPDSVEICDDLVVGTWVSVLLLEDRSAADVVTIEITLDGELLDAKRTQPKKMKFDDGTSWGFTEGVPVLGTLDAGVHTLEYTTDLDGDGGFPPAIFTITITVSSANC